MLYLLALSAPFSITQRHQKYFLRAGLPLSFSSHNHLIQPSDDDDSSSPCELRSRAMKTPLAGPIIDKNLVRNVSPLTRQTLISLCLDTAQALRCVRP